jgi:hypothetical protein
VVPPLHFAERPGSLIYPNLLAYPKSTSECAVQWFPKYKTVYAERIYGALAERELGDMTPEKLRLPKEKIQRYREKALFYREGSSVCALLEIANKHPELLPVLREYVGFVEAKRIGRGLQAGREQLVRAAVEDLCDMFTDPIKWARRWLTEFRDDPDGVVLFADHWRRQYEVVKGALEQNPTDPQHSQLSAGRHSKALPKKRAERETGRQVFAPQNRQ